jgi:hypothetical protein
VTKNDDTYAFYRFAKNIIERAERCCEKDHSEELKHWKDAVEAFDSLGKGYAELYKKEQENE